MTTPPDESEGLKRLQHERRGMGDAGYIEALERAYVAALAREQDRSPGRVVEVEHCEDGFCPCEYDMTQCQLLPELDPDADAIMSDPDGDDLGHGPVPSWCPLRDGPVAIVLKSASGGEEG
tara:strand:- start:711 stop:1073 length:363 start_codon:yes stop_codon:yes gene_type:complete